MSPLNFAQANNVASTLTILDEFCVEVQATLHDRESAHFLQYKNLPDDAKRKEILADIDALVAELRLTSRSLGVDVSPVDVQKKIRHQAALLIAGLGDLRFETLNRFGEPPVELKDKIENAVNRLVALLNRFAGA